MKQPSKTFSSLERADGLLICQKKNFCPEHSGHPDSNSVRPKNKNFSAILPLKEGSNLALSTPICLPHRHIQTEVHPPKSTQESNIFKINGCKIPDDWLRTIQRPCCTGSSVLHRSAARRGASAPRRRGFESQWHLASRKNSRLSPATSI